VLLYIHEYFDFVYGNSIVSDKNTIANVKMNTIYLCADSIDKNECYKVLKEYTTPKLKDGHSFFCTPSEWQAMIEEGKHPVSGNTLQNYPNGQMLNDNIAYLKLPTFVSNEKNLMALYVDSVQNMIARFDAQNPKGYIIDLSYNGGGNCFPMIAGVGPLIGNGVCEMSFSGDGSISEIIYTEGWTGRDTTLVFKKSNPYHLKNANKPVAVIYGNETASSGEVTAIAFIGLPNAKSFGQPTGGYSTRIDNFEMSDGAYLNLASGVNADRNKNTFGGKIKPDVETKDRESALSEASKWIVEFKR
jgi:C-terminal processing protease CtpA/Prc